MSEIQMRTILVDAVRGKDTADGIVSPVQSLKAAWKLLYELPDKSPVTVRLAKGEYPVASVLALYGEAMKNKPASLTIEGDGAVIHGKRDIPAAEFTPVEGKPYYMYQMEKVEQQRLLQLHIVEDIVVLDIVMVIIMTLLL